MRAIGLIVTALAVVTIAQVGTPKSASAQDAYSTAQDQAFALGKVLEGTRACEGDAWKSAFEEFMAAKRKRGLTGEQTAMVAALVGGAGAGAEPEMLECSDEGQARRAAAIDEMRTDW